MTLIVEVDGTLMATLLRTPVVLTDLEDPEQAKSVVVERVFSSVNVQSPAALGEVVADSQLF